MRFFRKQLFTNLNCNNLKFKLLVLFMLLANMALAQNVVVKPDYDKAMVCVEVDFPDATNGDFCQAEVSFEGQLVASAKSAYGQPLMLNMPDDFLRWTPDHPFLYNLKVCVLRNEKVLFEAERCFAMRCFGVCFDNDSVSRFTLNHLPVFLFGTQWTCDFDTPSSDEAWIAAIRRIKDLGFNMIRFYGNDVPQHFHDLCDRFGLLVWSDAESEVSCCMKRVLTISLNLPFGSDMETYEKYANRLYHLAFEGISAATIAPVSEHFLHDFDQQRVFRINRKISHAFAE